MAVVDRDKFPCLARFLDTLPQGLDSYPECRAKASMYLNLAAQRPVPADDVCALPEPLRRMSEEPLPVSSWIPEVHSQAMMLAIYDRRFADIDEFGQYAYVQGKALLEGPLYAVAFKLVPPSLLVKTAVLRWRMFHRGATLEAVPDGTNGATARIVHPSGLFEKITLRGICEGIRAALDLSTGGGASVEVSGVGIEHSSLRLRWNTR